MVSGPVDLVAWMVPWADGFGFKDSVEIEW